MSYNLTDYEENRLLDLSLLDGDLLCLMAVQGTEAATGTEVAGGGYARQAMGFANAAAGAKPTDTTCTFASLVAGDIQGYEIRDSTGTNRKWFGLWNPQSGTAQNTGDTITLAAHGLSNGQKIVFQDGYAPAGLSANTTYFVVGATTNTFQVSLTSGGAAVAITADSTLVQWGKVKTVVTTGDGFAVAAGAIVGSLG